MPKKQQRAKGKAQFSAVPDTAKHHAVLETVLVKAKPEMIWPYISDPDLMKKWRLALRGVSITKGSFSQTGSAISFDYTDSVEGALTAEVLAATQNKNIGFCIHHPFFNFDRFEWILLEAADDGATRVTIVADHQFLYDSMHDNLRPSLTLDSLTKMYRATAQKELAQLQSLFT